MKRDFYYPNEIKPTQNYVIRTTKRYDLFSYYEGNREINEPHLKRLLSSFEKQPFFTVIVTDEFLRIIDGQHRFEVLKTLNLPVNYIVVEGAGIKEIHLLNSTVQIWKPKDYINGYCDLGYPEYIKYKNFMDKYGIKQHEIAFALLNESRDPKVSRHQLKNGDYKITSLKRGEEIANYLQKVKHFYPNIYRMSFILAFIEIYSIPKFDKNSFLNKLKYNSYLLKDYVKKEQYFEVLSEIYNYRSREKVNFKFELEKLKKESK